MTKMDAKHGMRLLNNRAAAVRHAWCNVGSSAWRCTGISSSCMVHQITGNANLEYHLGIRWMGCVGQACSHNCMIPINTSSTCKNQSPRTQAHMKPACGTPSVHIAHMPHITSCHPNGHKKCDPVATALSKCLSSWLPWAAGAACGLHRLLILHPAHCCLP